MKSNIILAHDQFSSQLEFFVKKTKQGPIIEIIEKNAAKQQVNHLKFNPWQQKMPKESARWKLLVKDQRCLIYLVNPANPEKPEALYELHRDGKLSLHFAQYNGEVSVKSDFDFEIKTAAMIKKLKIEAVNFSTSKDAKLIKGEILDLVVKNAKLAGALSFKRAHLDIKDTLLHSGEMLVSDLDLKTAEIKQSGKILVENHYHVEATGLFSNDGEWISAQEGKIIAHAVQLGAKSRLVCQNGEIKIFAKSKLENSGAILGKFVSLEAMQINHYYGALLKGLSCLILAPQTNIAGFVLQGQKNSLSYIDWALSVVHVGVNLAQITSYLPLPSAMGLRGYLLLTKSLYLGADLLYKIAQGKEHEISKRELVSFFLDNVIPSLGVLTSEQEKAQLFVNVLYHFYSSFTSEDNFAQRSLNFVEAITRALPFAMGDIAWLKKATEMIRNTRYALKLTDMSIQAFSAWQSNEPRSLTNALTNLQTVAEGMFREILYALPPAQLLESQILINARDVALFILNKGHNSDLFLQSILYGALHVAKANGLLDEKKGYAELQTAVQFFFRGKAWQNIYQAYQANTLNKTQVINEVLQSLIVTLSYTAQKYPNIRPLEKVSVADSETIKSMPPVTSTEPEVLAEMPTTPEQYIQTNSDALKANEITVPEYQKEVLTLDVRSLFENNFKNQSEKTPEVNSIKQVCDVLLELQRAFNGDYAVNGHLAAFVGILHNEGVIESTGNLSIYAGVGVTNGNTIRAVKSIGLYGNSLTNTFFKNLNTGTIAVQEAVYIASLDLVKNAGFMCSGGKIKTTAVRIVENYKNGQFIAKEDVDILAECLAENAGFISGKNVNFEGKTEKSHNAGIIAAAEKIRLMSQKLVELSQAGYFISQQVSLESANVVKKGGINAQLVQTLGYQSEKPDEITWEKGVQDAIAGLILQSKKTPNFSKDAFNQVKITDLTLNELDLHGETLANIDANFTNTLQLHLPAMKAKIPQAALPRLSSEATLIVDAPESVLELGNNKDNPYPNTLRFIGEQCDYSNRQAHFLNPLLLDVDTIVGEGAGSALSLDKAGFLQARLLKNQGNIHADDILNWNLRGLDNEAQLESYTEYFQHSLQLPVKQQCQSTKVATGSGEIYALGHRGYAGEMNQIGGKFLSGKEGTFVYYQEGKQEAILTQQGAKQSPVLHESGQNWYVQPVWQNAEIGSKGMNVLIGSKPFVGKGFNFWGKTGAYLNSAKEVVVEDKYQSYDIPEVVSLKKNGKMDAVIHPHKICSVKTKNHISSDEGNITLVAQKGNVKLCNTVLSAAGNASLVAKNQVSINGVTASQRELERYRSGNLLNNKSINSLTTENKVYSSFIFTGGQLIVRADEFSLSAVQGVLAGADISARKTIFSGKEQTLDNKTVIKQFKISAPTVNNLIDVLHGENAKAVFKSFINACGWDQEELQALLHADKTAELPAPLLNISRNAWNLSAFVAKACKEYGESSEQFVGSITDKLGITTSENGLNRVFNPKINFNCKTTTKETHSNQMIGTDLYIGGTFRLVGEELQVLDGSKVDAEQLRIFLTEGIKATRGVDSTINKEKSKGLNLSVNAANLQDVSAGLTQDSSLYKTEHSHLARLHARDTAIIEAGKRISGDLKISSQNGGKVSASLMDFTTAQDTMLSTKKSKMVNASTSYTAGGHFNSEMKQSSYTTEKAGIDLPNGEVKANEICLRNGSKIETSLLSRLDGQEGFPLVSGFSSVDVEQEKRKGFSSHFVPGGSSDLSLEKHSHDKATIHRPTILASNVTAQSLPGINTVASNETEVMRDKHSGFALTALKPNLEKMSREGKEIKAAAKKAIHWAFDETARSKMSAPKSQAVNKIAQQPILPSNDVKFIQEASQDVLVAQKASSTMKAVPPRVQSLPHSEQNQPAEGSTPEAKIPLRSKQEKKAKTLSWREEAKLAWRSYKGEQSPEVSAWKARNRKAMPRGLAFTDMVEEQRKKMNAPLVKMKKFLKGSVNNALQNTNSALNSPDLSSVEHLGLEAKKMALKTVSSKIEKEFPASFEDLTMTIIKKAAFDMVKFKVAKGVSDTVEKEFPAKTKSTHK